MHIFNVCKALRNFKKVQSHAIVTRASSLRLLLDDSILCFVSHSLHEKDVKLIELQNHIQDITARYKPMQSAEKVVV